MCVAMRSRNQRSCEITMTLPANSSSASSSARSVSTSRSFDGSSSSSTLPPVQQRLGQVQPAALAAGQRADHLLLVAALEVEAADVGAARHLELADGEDVAAAGDVLPHGLVARAGSSRLWSTKASFTVVADRRPRRVSGFSLPVIIRNSVDLPAPFGPMMPTIAPGGTLKREVVDQQAVAEALASRS